MNLLIHDLKDSKIILTKSNKADTVIISGEGRPLFIP